MFSRVISQVTSAECPRQINDESPNAAQPTKPGVGSSNLSGRANINELEVSGASDLGNQGEPGKSRRSSCRYLNGFTLAGLRM